MSRAEELTGSANGEQHLHRIEEEKHNQKRYGGPQRQT